MNKKPYFVETLNSYKFVGFYSSYEEAYDANGLVYSDDDLYKMIEQAKNALNTIPLPNAS